MAKITLKSNIPPLRITDEEKQALQDLADADDRSLSNYIRRLLINHINAMQVIKESGTTNRSVYQPNQTTVDAMNEVTPVEAVDIVTRPAPKAEPSGWNVNKDRQFKEPVDA